MKSDYYQNEVGDELGQNIDEKTGHARTNIYFNERLLNTGSATYRNF